MADPLNIAPLVILSGPSGVGKSTVMQALIARYPGQLRPSVSATTRPARPGETDGADYHFLDPAEFERRLQAGEFLESCEVFGRGHRYGTLWDEVRPSRGDEKAVVLNIDVDGAENVRRQIPHLTTIFLRPGSEAELERRLRARGTETEAAIQRRLEVARRELAQADRYQFQVVNDTVDRAVGEISQILINQGIVKSE